MGYDIQRFTGEVDEELICPICTHVLEEPLQVCNGEAVAMNAWRRSVLIVLQSIFLNFRHLNVNMPSAKLALTNG